MFLHAAADGVGEAFMKKYVAQPRIPENARYGKAKEMVEKKVRRMIFLLALNDYVHEQTCHARLTLRLLGLPHRTLETLVNIQFVGQVCGIC